LRAETKDALLAHAPSAEFVDTSDSTLRYWEEFRKRWTGEADLVNVEHDIIIHEDVMPQFEACDSLWCVFPYPFTARIAYTRAMGCTKYSAELQRFVTREEIDRMREDECQMQLALLCVPECAEGFCWHRLDALLDAVFAKNRITEVCIHEPGVKHLNIEKDLEEMRPV
jgi:hypothetical protein